MTCLLYTSLMLVHGVEGVTYDELGEIELASGETRRCKVLEVNGSDVLVQLFESSTGINPVSYTHLDVYKRQVPQVKFVDRTFNCKHDHAMAIWNYIKEHDKGIRCV